MTLFKIKNLWSITSLFFIALLPLRSFACDVCGCASGGMAMGLGLDANSNFVGLRYSHVNFRANIYYNSFYTEDVHSSDTYNRYEAVVKYHILDRWYLNAQIPVIDNSMLGNTENVRHTGIGDLVFNSYYRVINPSLDSNKQVNHMLDLGLGMSFPTGEYQLQNEGELVNRNFQAGTGSYNYLAAANYIMSLQKWRVNAELNFKLNTANEYAYRFGNQFSSVLSMGRVFNYKDFSFYPSIGVFYEYSAVHKENRKIVVNSGGTAVLGDIGAQVRYKSFVLWFKYLPVLSQNYNTDKMSEIKGGNRSNVGIRFTW